SIILPPAALILLLSPIYFANQNSTLLAGALRGIEAAVVAAVVVAAWKMAQPVLGSWLSMLIAAASFLLLALTPVHPVAVVLVAGAIGAATLRPPGEGDRKPAAKREGASE
ncbi:MAG: chromate transporter, partial [Armatimonadetes bacterium]|nr:chromate transporter [Armatimonadota bacterium]